MINSLKFYKKICVFLFSIVFVLCTFGCENNDVISQPTPTVPVSSERPSSTGDIPSAETPSAEEEIHFNDMHLENVVRDTLGKNIGPIMKSDVEKITKFSARVEGILNINGLQYFTALEELDLYGNRISDISPLSSLTSLKKLNLGKNYNMLTAGSSNGKGLDLTPIKGLYLLRELDLSDNMITDIECLRSLTQLESLILKNNRISDISALKECQALVFVDVSDNFGLNADNSECGVADLSPLYEITSIETLIAGYNLVENLMGIESMTGLKHLDLSGNFVDDISYINMLPCIETVVLHYNSLITIDGFKDNKVIKHLDVSQNLITHFDVILTMTSLETLNWSQNNIQDYGPIDEFEEKINERG